MELLQSEVIRIVYDSSRSQTVKLFQTHGLKTSLLVCNGYAANLTTIKTTHGCSGAYSVLNDGARDKYEIKPWMINPFCPPDLIYWMICPTHQVWCVYMCIQVSFYADFTLILLICSLNI